MRFLPGASLTAPAQAPTRGARPDGYSAIPAVDVGVFALADPDWADVPPVPSRLGLEWDGYAFVEIDPATGAIVTGGEIAL